MEETIPLGANVSYVAARVLELWQKSHGHWMPSIRLPQLYHHGAWHNIFIRGTKSEMMVKCSIWLCFMIQC